MRDNGGDVGGVMIHVVAVGDLARSSVPAPIVGYDAISLLHEEEHLRIPIVAAQRPAMMKHHSLPISRTPILEIDRCSVLRRNTAHLCLHLTARLIAACEVIGE